MIMIIILPLLLQVLPPTVMMIIDIYRAPSHVKQNMKMSA